LVYLCISQQVSQNQGDVLHYMLLLRYYKKNHLWGRGGFDTLGEFFSLLLRVGGES